MSETRDVPQMLELAEQAAIKGDFSSADELLRVAARIQEAEMGPVHPDLANTLNSLAIVAERTGRFGDAEAFYRRSAAIASESLPASHPIVAESRKNLEDFCLERGVPLVPIEVAAAAAPSGQSSAVGLHTSVPEAPSDTQQSVVVPARHAKTRVSKLIEPPSLPGTPSPPVRPVPPPTPVPFPSAKPRSWLRVGWMPVAAAVLVAVAVLMRQPSSSEMDSTTVELSPVTESAPPLAPSPPPSALAPPAAQTPPDVVLQGGDGRAGTAQPGTAAPASGTTSLAAGQICQTFSTNRDGWQCDPPGDTVTSGPIVFYTRVRSPRDAEVVHRWYYGDTLRQTVRLTVRANVSEGYRTYSRHLVDRVGDWRVEAASDSGEVLYEQRFTVR